MAAFLIVLALLLLALILFAIVGARSRTIFTNPAALSDRQIVTTIDLTRRIMTRTRPGSPTWARAAAKHKAAVDEQLRRKGEVPFDNIELIGPE
jgi:hypothetical protein